jgi:adenosylhomocysteinase
MPGLESLKEEFARDKPLAGRGVLLHMHMTPETITLGEVLCSGGAQVAYIPSNRNPSAPAVVRRAEEHGGVVLEDVAQLDEITEVARNANLTFLVVEGNGRIFMALHQDPPRPAFFNLVCGISEHTSGGGRLVDSFDPAQLLVPVVAVYRNPLKTVIETGLGTSQTVAAALLRGLGKPVAGRRVVVVGFGNVGRGVARILRTLGARVTVVEKREEGCLQAHLEGFHVAGLADALPTADLCVTTTGTKSVVTAGIMEGAKEGLVVANVSNQPHEIDLSGCQSAGSVDGNLVSWMTPSGRSFYVLGGGLQVNHVVEAGNPAELMDLSFSLHALCLCWLVEREPAPGVYPVPQDLMERVAALVLGGRK